MSQPTRARTTGAVRTPRKHQNTSGAPPSDTTSATTVDDPAAGVLPAAPTGTADTDPLPLLPAVGTRPAAPLVGDPSPFTPQTLARTLRAVASELERDPALARRVAAALAADATTTATPAADPPIGASGGRPHPLDDTDDPADAPAAPAPTSSRLNRTFRPRLITGASPALGTGIPDPFALYSMLGEKGLRTTLDELRLGTLRAIIREHGLDPNSTLARQHDAARLRAVILASVMAK